MISSILFKYFAVFVLSYIIANDRFRYNYHFLKFYKTICSVHKLKYNKFILISNNCGFFHSNHPLERSAHFCAVNYEYIKSDFTDRSL